MRLGLRLGLQLRLRLGLYLDVGACTRIAVADTADVSYPAPPAAPAAAAAAAPAAAAAAAAAPPARRWGCAIRCKRDELVRALIASSSADAEESQCPCVGRHDRSRLVITTHEGGTAGLRVERVLAATRGREGDCLARAIGPAVSFSAGVQCIALLRGLPVHVGTISASACGKLAISARPREAD